MQLVLLLLLAAVCPQQSSSSWPVMQALQAHDCHSRWQVLQQSSLLTETTLPLAGLLSQELLLLLPPGSLVLLLLLLSKLDGCSRRCHAWQVLLLP